MRTAVLVMSYTVLNNDSDGYGTVPTASGLTDLILFHGERKIHLCGKNTEYTLQINRHLNELDPIILHMYVM